MPRARWQVMLNRPARMNAMNGQFWLDCRDCFTRVKVDEGQHRVITPHPALFYTRGNHI